MQIDKAERLLGYRPQDDSEASFHLYTSPRPEWLLARGDPAAAARPDEPPAS